MSADGQRWVEHRRGLGPRYGIVWRDLLVCWGMIAAGLASAVWVELRWGVLGGAITAPVVVLWLGFWIHAISNFGHEAAHRNLARDRKTNDRLADAFVWILFGRGVREYRETHWQHHLHLGDHEDSEVSYHNCLSPWFLASVLSGLHPFRVWRRHSRVADEQARKKKGEVDARWAPLLRSVLFHAVMIALLFAVGTLVAPAVWVAAVGLAFPTFVSLRQILEHRDADAGCEIDFERVLHGPLTRMFGSDPFSYFFGAAGFNRHLLHHWDPGISYTRFDEMESFFARTAVARELAASRTSYWSAFVRMLATARR